MSRTATLVCLAVILGTALLLAAGNQLAPPGPLDISAISRRKFIARRRSLLVSPTAASKARVR